MGLAARLPADHRAMPSTWWTGAVPDSDMCLFDRLGGPNAMASIVAALYGKAQADDELAPYFHRTDIDEQRRKLADMLGEATGGPAAPWLLGLAEAHRGRGITDRHFSLLAAHLVDVLEAAQVGDDDLDDVMLLIAHARDAIVDD